MYGDVTFVFIKYNNLILLSVTKTNANAALIFSFLHKLVAIFCEYFKELEEESIRDNFVLIYELLDEVMDFGYPQTTGASACAFLSRPIFHSTQLINSPALSPFTNFFPTDSKILQEFITQESHKLDIAPRPPMAVTNAVSWRSEGIKYRKNEVFLDVIGISRWDRIHCM